MESEEIHLTHSDEGKANPELCDPHWFDTWEKSSCEPTSTYTCYLNGKPASVLRFFNCNLWLPNVSIDFVGIGGVFTVPQHRKKGLASRLLSDLVYHHEDLFPGALLFGLFTRNPNFYANFGFHRSFTNEHGDFLWFSPSPNLILQHVGFLPICPKITPEHF